MRFAGRAVEQIGKPRIEIDLDEDRHRQHGDDQRLPEDLLALEAEQENERRQQGEERDRLQAGQDPRQRFGAAARQHAAPHDLRNDDRNDDVENDGQQQGFPRDGDRRQAEQQSNDRREREHHDDVVERDLAEREMRLAVRQVAPHEYHGGARRRRQQNEAG